MEAMKFFTFVCGGVINFVLGLLIILQIYEPSFWYAGTMAILVGLFCIFNP